MYLFLLFTTIYLQLKYPNRSYLFLYKTKDRYSILSMNIDPFYTLFKIDRAIQRMALLIYIIKL